MPGLYDFDFQGDTPSSGAYNLPGFPTVGGSENFGFGNMLSGFGLPMPDNRTNTPQTNPGSWYTSAPTPNWGIGGNAPMGWLSSLSDALYKAVLGRSPSNMASDLGATRAKGYPWTFPQSNIMSVYGGPGQFDKALHAYSSYLAQQRFGSLPAFGLGLGKEGLDLFTGQASTDDLSADLLGILLGRQQGP